MHILSFFILMTFGLYILLKKAGDNTIENINSETNNFRKKMLTCKQKEDILNIFFN